MNGEHDEMGSVVGDARKRRTAADFTPAAQVEPVDIRAVARKLGDQVDDYFNHDEQHAHLHEWPDMDDS